jgi:hypothetical protein
VNNLIYGNQDPGKIGPAVEEKVRKDLGATVPIDYRVEDAGLGATNLASVLVDIGSVLGGGKTNLLFILVLPLPCAREATLRARVERQGIGAYVGSLLYSTTLSKPVASEISIEGHKSFGTPKFLGDATAAAKLNGARDLAKRVDKFARTEAEMGSIKVKSPRIFAIAPHEGGSLLVINTLPRMTSMGMGAEVDAREFVEIAAAIEASL